MLFRPLQLLLIAFAVGAAHAFAPPVSLAADPDPAIDASSVRALLIYGKESDQQAPEPGVARARSVPLALGLSAIMPGLGQAYNGHWIKAAAGIAIEVALVAGYLHYRDRGQSGEDAYQAYAHGYWSPAKYAQWLQDYSDWLPAVQRQEFDIPFNIDFSNPGSWTADDRARVRQLFNDIRAVEGLVYHPETSAAFSHKLPYFAEQQYYELVGKYFQFAPGWVDYAGVECPPGGDCRFPWVDQDGNYVDTKIDPERTGTGGTKPNVQGRMLEYARDHAAANDLLRTASRMTSFVVLNHVVAAIDAAVFAKLHNDRLSSRVSATVDAFGDVVPSASVRLSF